MGIKKGMVFLFVALFIAARILPALPSLKTLSGAAQLISHPMPVLLSADQHSADQDTGDDDTDDKDNVDKDIEKDFGKSVIDYHTMLLDSSLAIVYQNNTQETLFLLYRWGKVRDHVNEVFRPPLV